MTIKAEGPRMSGEGGTVPPGNLCLMVYLSVACLSVLNILTCIAWLEWPSLFVGQA